MKGKLSCKPIKTISLLQNGEWQARSCAAYDNFKCGFILKKMVAISKIKRQTPSDSIKNIPVRHISTTQKEPRLSEDFSIRAIRDLLGGKDMEQEVDMLDLPYDFDSLIAAGSMSGSGAIIVLDDSTDIVEALSNIADFYAHESCGQCTPCREGSLWMAKALHRMTHGQGRKQDADYLVRIADNIPGGRTICAFGEACSWPVQSFVGKFKDEFVAKGAADEERAVQTPRRGAQTKEMKLAENLEHS